MDHKGRFPDVCSGFFGNCSDRYVFEASGFGRALRRARDRVLPVHALVVGDAAYSGTSGIVIPFPTPVYGAKFRLNTWLFSNRQVVEAAFGAGLPLRTPDAAAAPLIPHYPPSQGASRLCFVSSTLTARTASMTSRLARVCCIIANFLHEVDPDGLPSWEESMHIDAEHDVRLGRHLPADDDDTLADDADIESIQAAERARTRLFRAWCRRFHIDPSS